MSKRQVASQAPPDDDGLTLVEMVVALFLAALVLTSFVGVAIAGAGASRVADTRSRANQVGNQELERLKALAWANLGLYDGDGASCGSEAVSSLGATAPSPRLAPSYQRTVTVDGRSYTVTDCITWTDDPADGLAANGTETDTDNGNDVKHLVVSVDWTLASKTRSVSFNALRTPTTVEVPPTVHTTGATLALTANTPSPSTQQLAGDYSLSTPMTLSVTANLAATSMSVTYTGRAGSVTTNLSSTDGGLNWSLQIPAGSTGGTFNPGTTTFRFAGSSASGSAQATTTANLTAPPTPFTLTATASPSSITLDTGGYLTAALTLRATTSVAATSVTVSYPIKTGTGSGTLTTADGGITWNLVLPANTSSGPYSPASPEVFTFTGTSASGSTTGTASATLTAPAPPAVVVTSVAVQGYASGNLCADTNSANAGKTKAAQDVKITISNLVASDKVTLSWTNSSTGGPVNAGTGVASGSDYVFTATIPGSTPFTAPTGSATTTTTTFTVGTIRASDGANNQATQAITVQWKKSNQSCT